jgi:hypothetical protein
MGSIVLLLALALILTQGSPRAQSSQIPVLWAEAVGVSIDGNSLTKTAAAGWGNAGAVSAQRLVSGDGHVEVIVTETSTGRVFGLSNGNTDQGYPDIDFGLNLVAGGPIRVWEGGLAKGLFKTYAPGDRLQVAVESGAVRYKLNGVAFYTSSASPTYPLLVDTAFNHANGTLTQAVVEGNWVDQQIPVEWTAAVGVDVTENSIAKTISGGGWDAGAASAQRLDSGDGYVEATASETNKGRMFGLSKGNPGEEYTEIDYAINLSYDGSLGIWENGTFRGTVGTYAMGNRVRVAVEAGAVTYRKDGALLYSSAVSPAYPLLVDAALNALGSTVRDATISGNWSGAPVVWDAFDGVTVSGSSLTKTASTAWANGGAVSVQRLESGDGYVEVSAGQNDTHRLIGLSNGNSSSNWDDIDFGLYLYDTGELQVYEAGVLRGTFGTYAATDFLRVELSGGIVTYKQNGTVFYTSTATPTYPLLVDTALYTQGALLADPIIGGNWTEKFEEVAWTAMVNSSARGNDLHKTSHGYNWDAGAVSTMAIVSGDGFVEFAGAAGVSAMAGLSNGDSNEVYTDIDYAIYVENVNLVVFEAGVYRGNFATFETGDRLRVAVESGAVVYRKNGEVFYTSSVAPTYPLLVDTSLYRYSSDLRDAVVSGALVPAAVPHPQLSPGSGTYTTSQIVTVTGEPGASIHYTQDGTDPDQSSATIASGSPLTVDQPETLKLRAYASGLIPSGVTEATYVFETPVTEDVVWTEIVNASAAGNDLTKTGSSSLWDSGAVSTKAIVGGDGYAEVTGTNGTFRMIGLSFGDTDQTYPDIDYALYVKNNRMDVWEAGIYRGEFGSFQPGDQLRVAVESGIVVYRKNGLAFYTSGVAPTFPLVVDASLYSPGAVLTDVEISGVLENATLSAPQFSPGGGTYATPETVTITAEPGATIHYTDDGTDPDETSPNPPGPLSIDQPTTLKARAYRAGYLPSDVASANYNFQAGTPGFSPPPGTFSNPTNVALSTATPGASIRYTLDGSEPTPTSSLYSAPIPVPASMTIKAKAFFSGWADSVTATGTYVISANLPPQVSAGPDIELTLPGTANLAGTVQDDGLPIPPGAVSVAWSKLSGPGTVGFGSPTSITTTATFSKSGTYVLRLTANDGAAVAYDDVVVNAQASVLFVVGSTQSMNAQDVFLRSRFEAAGYTVVTKAGADVVNQDSNGRAFVWLSSTSSASDVQDFVDFWLWWQAVPIAVQSAGIVDNMIMTSPSGRGNAGSQTSAVVTTPTHPISAGKTGTAALNTSPANHAWGTPSANGVKVLTRASPPNQAQATVFTYEQGVGMYGGEPAPERRLFFGPGATALSTFTPDGLDVLDAAILWLGRKNAAPWVDAGPDLAGSVAGGPVVLNLNGHVLDDGLPNPPGTVMVQWSQIGGGPLALFGDPSQAATTATFNAPGTYFLKLSADDSLQTSFDLVEVEITEGAVVNAPPVVTASPDQVVRLPATATVIATAFDDGLPSPPGALTYQWSLVSGPGTVGFGSPAQASTTASFSAPGVYVLRVIVDDGDLEASDETQVRVDAAKSALFVTGDAYVNGSHAFDAPVLARLAALGFDVTIVGGGPGATPNGYDLVVISEVASAAALESYGALYPGTTTPILCFEYNFYDWLDMTGTSTPAHYGVATNSTITIPSLSHPIQAGLSGSVSFRTSQGPISYGVPSAPEYEVAHIQGSGQPAVFAYPEGVLLFNTTSAGRRVGFPYGADGFTPEAFAMLDAAIEWLTTPPIPTLLVTGPGDLSPADKTLRNHLAAVGYAPEVRTAAEVTAAHAQGKALIFVSASAPGSTLGTKLRDVSVPAIVARPDALVPMALTAAGDSGSVSATQVDVVDSEHPLSAHLAGLVSVQTSSATTTWGIPGPEGFGVATLATDPTRFTSFGYEAGADMVGVPALERRVGLWANATSSLTAEGGLLLDAAIQWALQSDGDGDGLGYGDEIAHGTDPQNPDTNGDGILDGAAVDSGISPTDEDMDGDGLTNAQEATIGTDPFLFDTDGDGVGDGADCFPLDPDRDTCPPGTHTDTTPPDITLTEPTNAVLISSVP